MSGLDRPWGSVTSLTGMPCVPTRLGHVGVERIGICGSLAVEQEVVMSDARPTASDTGRTEAFSDGVMAIAITLLILDVRLGEPSGKGLGHDLAHLWPSYAAYLASFLTIGIIWLNHHAFFSRLAHIDPVLLWWNLALLLAVSFLPFPTAVVADHLRDGGADARTAVVFYALAGAGMTIPWVFLWRRLAVRPELFVPGFDRAFARGEGGRAWVGVGAYAVCALVALVSAYVRGGPRRRDRDVLRDHEPGVDA